jgi:DNA mismatch endonuclease (patch repair protein)
MAKVFLPGDAVATNTDGTKLAIAASSPQVSAQMSRHPSKDTGPEVALRRILHARGLRYRVHLHVPGLPRRTIDIAFPRAKVAVFIDGCFWHGCPEHGTLPRSNRDWWRQKLDGNRRRDEETAEHLARLGWHVMRFWSHDDLTQAADAVTVQVPRVQAGSTGRVGTAEAHGVLDGRS